MTPYEEATRTVPLVDAALANFSTMEEWRDQPASTTVTNTTGEHHQLVGSIAVLADPVQDDEERPPDEQQEEAAAAVDGGDAKPSRQGMMPNLSNKNNKRWLIQPLSFWSSCSQWRLR